MVAKISIDTKENEAYISDGYGNKRVVVIDADTGKFKRYWGAYGNKPDDTNLGRYNPDAPPAQQFRTPVHCAEMSNDGLVYVCDRVERSHPGVHAATASSSRKRGSSKDTLGDGSTWDIAFSNDPQQKFIYLADGQDEKVWILDRQSLEILTSFGDGGKHARPVLRRAQHRHRLEGQHLHDRDLRRPPPAALPLQGDAEPSRRARIRARSGRTNERRQ